MNRPMMIAAMLAALAVPSLAQAPAGPACTDFAYHGKAIDEDDVQVCLGMKITRERGGNKTGFVVMHVPTTHEQLKAAWNELYRQEDEARKAWLTDIDAKIAERERKAKAEADQAKKKAGQDKRDGEQKTKAAAKADAAYQGAWLECRRLVKQYEADGSLFYRTGGGVFNMPTSERELCARLGVQLSR
jgi:hypothetical protein